MKIAFHAPLPPARTGVADYAAGLLKALAGFPGVEAGNPNGPDIHLYHLGNNELHREIYFDALSQPGVVVLHDAVLQHFFLGALSRQEYIEEFVYNYGEWHRPLAEQLWRERARSALDPRYFGYPMLRRTAETSLAVVVHNPAAAEAVRFHAPGARIAEIPHFYPDQAEASGREVEHLRASLGLRPSGLLFGVFGHLRETKRLSSVLAAFARVRAETPGVFLLVAGSFASADLERAVRPMLAQEGVICRGFLPESKWAVHAQAVDACINLRYPAAGETSGIAIRLMGLGKPVILTRSAENARFPEPACLKVDSGPAECEMLAAYMVMLARTPGALHHIGQRAREHVRRYHALTYCAQRYVELLRAITTAPARTLPRRPTPEARSAEAATHR